jgi:hypothetical protein
MMVNRDVVKQERPCWNQRGRCAERMRFELMVTIASYAPIAIGVPSVTAGIASTNPGKAVNGIDSAALHSLQLNTQIVCSGFDPAFILHLPRNVRVAFFFPGA